MRSTAARHKLEGMRALFRFRNLHLRAVIQAHKLAHPEGMCLKSQGIIFRGVGNREVENDFLYFARI
jgi:hypothetical protein